ncbi:MAG: sulfur carrier protein ThiS adenylyltransferase ThiF [Bacteroidales bacterium]
MTEREIRGILARCTVGIAGCGGLGSNCAVALARIGIGRLILVDFDRIEESNLNRQYYFRDQLGMPKVEALQANIGRIDSRVVVSTHFLKLTPENIPVLFKGCDVVVEAFDHADQKLMIIETILEHLPGMSIVSGSGMAGWGGNELIRTEQFGNLVVCGDHLTEVSEEMPPLAPRVGIVSGMQANAVLEILINKSK